MQEKGGEKDESESEDIEQENQLDGDESLLLGGVEEVSDEIESLDEDTEGVNGDEEHGVLLEEGVVNPKHGAEERNHVRNGLKSFRSFLLVDLIECRQWSKGDSEGDEVTKKAENKCQSEVEGHNVSKENEFGDFKNKEERS